MRPGDDAVYLFPQRTLRGPELRRRPDQLPRDPRLPALYRQLPRRAGEAIPQGDLARDPHLAMLEAALFAADEPLTARKLAAAASLVDGNQARRLLRKLQ